MQLYLRNKISYYVLIVIAVYSILSSNFFINWSVGGHPFVYDVNQYYSYIIAVFHKKDVFFEHGIYGFWLQKAQNGSMVPKVTYGVSLFYLPFYLLARLFAPNSSSGYELVYAWFIHFGCIVYVLLGFYFIRKTLKVFFDDNVVAITIALIFFGSNLFCYTVVNPEYPHSILFFLIALFVYYTTDWHSTSVASSFYKLCFITGLVALIRPTEILILLIPLLFGVTDFKSLRNRFKGLMNYKWKLGLGAFLLILPLMPQLIYWKLQTDHFFFFSYGSGERFFWTDPQIFNVLFSYRKGWLVYSPIMIFSIIGIVISVKQKNSFMLSVLLYFAINLYVISCWWDWAYGGAFGMRALVHSYALLVFPMATFIKHMVDFSKKLYVKTIFGVIATFLCFLNMFQTNQYKHGIINYDGMTEDAYWFVFLKRNFNKEDLLRLESRTVHPDYSAMKQGQRNQ